MMSWSKSKRTSHISLSTCPRPTIHLCVFLFGMVIQVAIPSQSFAVAKYLHFIHTYPFSFLLAMITLFKERKSSPITIIIIIILLILIIGNDDYKRCILADDRHFSCELGIYKTGGLLLLSLVWWLLLFYKSSK